MGGYKVVNRGDADDWMAAYPGFGEMRTYTGALENQEVALTWRLMPPGTGGKGSYGHRHKDQEEVYLVLRGSVQFKLGDDELELGPGTAVRVDTDVFRSVHNEGPDEAELIICSRKAQDDEAESEMVDEFWPE